MVTDRRALLAYVDELRSRLAEAEALLWECVDYTPNKWNNPRVERIRDFLSADSATHRENDSHE